MTSLAARASLQSASDQCARIKAASRDPGIDTMRGIAILMVIGIHSLRQPLDSWEVAADAVLRPCVPVFLFVSGYLTALSGKVPLWKRLKATLIPYAIAFVAAYIYMALDNPGMDHRPQTTLARFVLAYVFVYYYVFVYVGCTIALWLIFSAASSGMEQAEHGKKTEHGLATLLLLAVLFGLIAGSYLDPLLYRLGFSDAVVEEVRMRDIPFWFSFTALGALAGVCGIRPGLPGMRAWLAGATFLAYIIYVSVRLFGLGDAADYDSIAFFGYAALLCILLLALEVESPLVASLGSGSYFIYLWHIFIVMILRGYTPLRQLGPMADSAITYAVAASGSVVALVTIRELASPRLCRWLGA
ncbi:acyltransferase [Bradyrhizobium sp. dw_78]|uniref:acyltransferase n=1 Tax=Bradyrhizobium sp. dw_78 TaxID=2719793 RepID=UPI00201BC1F1|nr:acyltransferase [Bradyrhizobium sp. dw_78]